VRPRRLSVENFTCYRDSIAIDFEDMDVFVISGPTGAGKTTLIDAICYALYGRVPRDVGKQTSTLVAHGRDRMRVAFEFEAAGVAYRVTRGVNLKRRTNKSGKEQVSRDLSPVQFEVYERGEWQPVADRVDEAEAAIERAVGLDFDGFTRCVLLPQGQFAEFLTGDPKDRRQIFTRLLELGVYERMMQIANRRHDDRKRDADHTETRLREDYADATEEALAEARRQIGEVRPALESARVLNADAQEAVALASAARTARARCKQRRDALAAKEAEIKDEEALARDGDETLARLAQSIVDGQAARSQLEYDPRLEATLRAAHERARHVERLAAQLQQARAGAADSKKAAAAERAVAAATKAHEQAAGALARADEAVGEMHRDHAVAVVRTGLKPGDACPVCGGAIGRMPKGKSVDVGAAERAQKDARAAERAAAGALAKAERELALVQQRLAQGQEAVAEREREAERAAAQLAEALPPGVSPELAVISSALAAQEQAASQAAELERALEQLRVEREALQARFAEANARIARLRGEAGALESEAAAADDEAKRNIDGVRAVAERRAWADVLALIAAAKYPGELLAARQAAAEEEVSSSTAALARLEGAVERIELGIARAAELREQLAATRAEAARYRELGTLLRGNNFLDYVIQEAMRALASSATAHLQRLYPRFSLAADGGAFSVVDGWSAGSARSARTLSGGETFVVSLALALALSERLPELQQRAARALESLFLDEGFGTLDRDTLDPVIEMLESLRSERRMVGIITHVPELAQRIGQRIEVQKSEAGSRIEVVRG
jgi:exonuclease SbcC